MFCVAGVMGLGVMGTEAESIERAATAGGSTTGYTKTHPNPLPILHPHRKLGPNASTGLPPQVLFDVQRPPVSRPQ